MNFLKKIYLYILSFFNNSRMDAPSKNDPKIIYIKSNISIDERIDELSNIFKSWYHQYFKKQPHSNDNSFELYKNNYKISIEQYIQYIVQATELSVFIRDHIEQIIITTMIYLDRINEYNHYRVDENTFFYLFIIAFCLSIKYHYDELDYISGSYIIQTLFHIVLPNYYCVYELHFLRLIHYNLFITNQSFLDKQKEIDKKIKNYSI